jgi:hypothetical protein
MVVILSQSNYSQKYKSYSCITLYHFIEISATRQVTLCFGSDILHKVRKKKMYLIVNKNTSCIKRKHFTETEILHREKDIKLITNTSSAVVFNWIKVYKWLKSILLIEKHNFTWRITVCYILTPHILPQSTNISINMLGNCLYTSRDGVLFITRANTSISSWLLNEDRPKSQEWNCLIPSNLKKIDKDKKLGYH